MESGRCWPLAPLSLLWGGGVWLRKWFYDFGCVSPVRVSPVVVSVGNVEVGGTGKTPLVLLLAESFRHRKVAILSRGYGKVADEAMVLERRVRGVQVGVGKDRVKLAREMEVDLVILDDGFQYRKLARDFDLVLVTRKREHYLPWGRLRDTPRRVRGEEEMVFRKVVKRVVDGKGGELDVRGKEIAYFCGIARPERFKKMLLEMGGKVVRELVLGDHERVEVDELEELGKGIEWILTTEKDFVKIPKCELPIYYVELGTEVVAGRKEWETLIEKIDQEIDNRKRFPVLSEAQNPKRENSIFKAHFEN